LAESRAEYATLVASVADHTRLLEGARKNLVDARARQAGALSASVINRIDGVEAGVRPVGPGRKMVTAAGGVSGLLLGLGCVFLFASPVTANRDVSFQEGVTASHNSVVAANGHTNGHTVPVQKPSKRDAFGLFDGMTLEQAIRSSEQRG
jgi:hypothetical protein